MAGTMGKKRVLVIEDNANIREMLSVYLPEEGYDVSFSENGMEGLDDARQMRPDLILLDLWLPGRSGEEVCKAIREDANKRFAHTPILMVTAKVSDVDRVIGMVIGATGYLCKPFRLAELVQEMRRCLDTGNGRVPQAA